MTHDEKVKNTKKRDNQQRILDFIDTPKTYYQIHVALDLGESYIRQLMLGMPDNWRNGDMVKGRGIKMVSTFYAIGDELQDFKTQAENKQQVIYNNKYDQLCGNVTIIEVTRKPDIIFNMDDLKFTKDELRMMRPSNKSARVWVSGSSLSGV
jgi:hypothetical protein